MAIPTPSVGRWTRFGASAELALFYVDSSALVKLVREEPESAALRTFLSDADLLSCELVLTELPRAIRRASAIDPRFPLARLLERVGELLESLALLPLDRALLLAAGALADPALRALDAIHVAAAVDVSPLDAFVSYDERQAAAARLAGLLTVQPGGGLGLYQGRAGSPAVQPPSTGSTTPVIALASGLARNTIALAI